MPLNPTPVPTGPEFRVSDTGQNQRGVAITSLADGGFAVAWQASDPSGGDGFDIYARRYAASGTAASDQVRVNGVVAGEQAAPDVAGLAGGGFVVTWQDSEASSASYYDIHARRLAADGGLAGDEFVVAGGGYTQQKAPSVAAVSDGGFVVTWDNGHASGGSPHTVGVRRFAEDGTAVGGFGAGFFRSDDIGGKAAALPDGGVVVAWQSFGGYPLPGGAGHDVYVQQLPASGSPAPDALRANSAVGGDQITPDIATLSGGGLVVVWRGPDLSAAGGSDIYARLFDANGTPFAGEFRVNGAAAGDRGAPGVAALEDGGFVVTWQSGDPSGASGLDVHAQRFGADGAAVGGEVRVHDVAAGDQGAPEVAALAGGGFVVTWQGADGIHARTFETPGASGPPAVPGEARIAAVASSQAEGDVGARATFAFDVDLDAASSAARSVRWQVEGRGPRPADAADFEGGVLPSGELVFAAGETKKTVTVRVAGDAAVEADEGFAVSLREPSEGLGIGTGGSAAATVLDDDSPASVPPAHAAKVVRLYDAALDRLPDREGFGFWVGALQDGEALPALAAGFLASAEFAARFGDASADDGAFVERLYLNVLGRAGEAEGRAFWEGCLGGGGTRAQVLAAFSESAEHVALSAAAFGGESGVLLA